MAFKRTVTLRASFRFPAIRFDAPTLLSFSGFTHAHAKCPPVILFQIAYQITLLWYICMCQHLFAFPPYLKWPKQFNHVCLILCDKVEFFFQQRFLLSKLKQFYPDKINDDVPYLHVPQKSKLQGPPIAPCDLYMQVWTLYVT